MGFKVRNILIVHNFNCATIQTVSTFTTFEKGDLKNISFIHPNFLIIGQNHNESIFVGEAVCNVDTTFHLSWHFKMRKYKMKFFQTYG